MIAIEDDDDEVSVGGAAERLLDAPIDAVRYPVLAAALAGPNALALRRELMDLFAPQLRARAPRRTVRANAVPNYRPGATGENQQGQSHHEHLLVCQSLLHSSTGI